MSFETTSKGGGAFLENLFCGFLKKYENHLPENRKISGEDFFADVMITKDLNYNFMKDFFLKSDYKFITKTSDADRVYFDFD